MSQYYSNSTWLYDLLLAITYKTIITKIFCELMESNEVKHIVTSDKIITSIKLKALN